MISNILKKINSLPDIFFYNEKIYPNKKFLYSKIDKEWSGKSLKDSKKTILKIAYFLHSKQITKNDKVFLISTNRSEWVEIDLAIMMIGAVTVPCFPTNSEDDNKFIIQDCNPKLIIIENEKIYKRNHSLFKKIHDSKIFMIDDSKKYSCYRKINDSTVELKTNIKIKKSDISTIIYTSGTSGNPKGVVLKHDSMIHNLEAAAEILKGFNTINGRFISFLPLSHSYERIAGLYFPMLINGSIYFCSSLDKLLSEIKEVKPTIFSAVPRLYENIHKKIKLKFSAKRNLFLIFINLILEKLEANQLHMRSNMQDKVAVFIIKFFLKNKVKEIFGGKVKVLISGGAALNPSTGLFFTKIGFDLLQGYGQTEAAPLISCNTKINNDPRTVGFPVKNTQIRISKDNEILVKGRNVMQEYWGNKNLTLKTVKKGWLHTGDLGYFDDIGRLIIYGRKKDLIVTSGGDNISPQKIENLFTQHIEIDQIVIFGDNKPFLVALIVLSDDFKTVNINSKIIEINMQLSSLEKIRKFIIIEKFTAEDGLVTPTLKLKKDKIYKLYENKILDLYR